MIDTLPGVTRAVYSDGTVRFVLSGTIGLREALRVSWELTRDLLDGHRSFVLDLTAAGEIDPRLWPKLVDWTLKLEQIRRPGEQPSRFHFEGVDATHRAAIVDSKLDRLYAIRGLASGGDHD